ncbi:CRISPR system Cascade subunit CasE [Amycolatopsis arida]|uniref:CRISPR system Cascade subunit CasE n=1 Tax=Amycolatopsis arida TaxID=587909 RepID=A0A1I5R1B4_9PSEU|nr:type I-E CRISPR-associated protein Cas6/Cse3/CasE [Amycolatopsis arida]TDX99038.1 CRISPR system Cascade subunit CasE [Amycolatopsis arida]SFP52289.1 CRISPR system Cascade subunit CasE [Amycolatopsis arida]
MFLSRFEFDTARRAARELLASPQALHAAVAAVCSSDRPRESGEGRVLWRVDHTTGGTVLYLVSPHRPELDDLAEVAGSTTQGWEEPKPAWETRDYAPLLDRLAAGDRWAFRLTANPVVSRRKSAEAKRSQRFGHVTATHQTAWLLKRIGKHGFAVVNGESGEPDLAVRGRRTLRFSRRGSEVVIATATFEGVLEVTDPAALRRALTSGIGPAKGYGCGLLTLARAR